MNIQAVFDPHAALRTSDQWKAILRWAVQELEEVLGVPARMTDFNTCDDKPGYKSHDNGVEVMFDTQAQLGYKLCGCVCCLVNVGEGVRIDAEFLAFSKGIRVPAQAHQVLVYVFDSKTSERGQWSCEGWSVDASGEWDSTKDDSRWTAK